MRAIMVVNPNATTTSPRVTDVIVRALSNDFELEVTITNHRGHAFSLGEYAQNEAIPIAFTLGGDGVVNEFVNGLLHDGPSQTVLAPIPGGSGNVFARALGIPADPVEATGAILEAIREGNDREINIGHIHAETASGEIIERYFLANAGLGFDAQIIEAMDKERDAGHVASPRRYLLTTVREYFTNTDRKSTALQIGRVGTEAIEHVFIALVQNASPWTFFKSWALDPNPAASFDTGLDVFIVRKLDLVSTLLAAGKVIARTRNKSAANAYTSWHDQREFWANSLEPVPLQADGEGLGMIVGAQFSSRPRALRTVNVLSK